MKQQVTFYRGRIYKVLFLTSTYSYMKSKTEVSTKHSNPLKYHLQIQEKNIFESIKVIQLIVRLLNKCKSIPNIL